ncbi:MAG: DMT family transporter [Polyangiaceae bacterium]
MSTRDLRGHALVAMAAMGWGTWSLFFRNAEKLGPLTSYVEGAVMMGVMSLATLPVALRSPSPSLRASRLWITIAVVGLIDAMNVLLFFRAMQLTSVAIAVLSHSVSPVLVALASPWVAGEPRRWSTLLAALVAFGGMALLLEPWSSPSAGALVGAAYGGASALFTAANVLGQKRLSSHFSPAQVLSFHGLVSTLVLMLFVPAGGWSLSLGQWVLLLAGSIGPGAIGGLAFTTGLAKIPATHASMLVMLEPCVAVLIGITVWGERLGALGIVGAALVIAGLVVAVRK